MLSKDDEAKIIVSLHRATMAMQDIHVSLPRLRRLMNKWERGGLPGASMPEPVSGASDHDPGFDRMDRDMRRHVRRFLKDSELIEQKTAALWELMSLYLTKAGVLEDEACKNPACGNRVSSYEKTCARCRMHKHRHGLEWPKKRVSVTNTQRVGNGKG